MTQTKLWLRIFYKYEEEIDKITSAIQNKLDAEKLNLETLKRFEEEKAAEIERKRIEQEKQQALEKELGLKLKKEQQEKQAQAKDKLDKFFGGVKNNDERTK